MQDWMIVSIAAACAIVVIAAATLFLALLAAHLLLGRKIAGKKVGKSNNSPEHYGVDVKWFGLVKHNTTVLKITAYDNITLGAELVKHKTPSRNVAICCHGFGATMHSVQPQAKLFYELGFDVLIPSMRGHEISGGKVGMAWLDRFDVARWVDKVIAEYGGDVNIALFGTSMGGSTAIAVAGMNPPSQVKCVIDDCGFSSQAEQYKAYFRAPTVLFIKMGVRLVHGYSVADADIKPLAKNVRVPALFIHGEKDDFVPFELGKRLYDACGSAEKSMLAVENAEHARAFAVDRERYISTFTEFLSKHFSDIAPLSEDLLDYVYPPVSPEPAAQDEPESVDTSSGSAADGDVQANDDGHAAEPAGDAVNADAKEQAQSDEIPDELAD